MCTLGEVCAWEGGGVESGIVMGFLLVNTKRKILSRQSSYQLANLNNTNNNALFLLFYLQAKSAQMVALLDINYCVI